MESGRHRMYMVHDLTIVVRRDTEGHQNAPKNARQQVKDIVFVAFFRVIMLLRFVSLLMLYISHHEPYMQLMLYALHMPLMHKVQFPRLKAWLGKTRGPHLGPTHQWCKQSGPAMVGPRPPPSDSTGEQSAQSNPTLESNVRSNFVNRDEWPRTTDESDQAAYHHNESPPRPLHAASHRRDHSFESRLVNAFAASLQDSASHFRSYRPRSLNSRCQPQKPNIVTSGRQAGRGGSLRGYSRSCDRCKKKFKNWKALKRHIEQQCERSRIYRCGHCDFSTPRAYKAANHHRSHSDDTEEGHCNNPDVCGTSVENTIEAHYALGCSRCGRCFFQDLPGFVRHWRYSDCPENEDGNDIGRLEGLLSQPIVKAFVDTVLIPQLGGRGLLTSFLLWCLEEEQSRSLVAQLRADNAIDYDRVAENVKIRAILEGWPAKRTLAEHASDATQSLGYLLQRYRSRDSRAQQDSTTVPLQDTTTFGLDQAEATQSLQFWHQPSKNAQNVASQRCSTQPSSLEDTVNFHGALSFEHAISDVNEQIDDPACILPRALEEFDSISGTNAPPQSALEHVVEAPERSYGCSSDDDLRSLADPRHYMQLIHEQKDDLKFLRASNSSPQSFDADTGYYNFQQRDLLIRNPSMDCATAQTDTTSWWLDHRPVYGTDLETYRDHDCDPVTAEAKTSDEDIVPSVVNAEDEAKWSTAQFFDSQADTCTLRNQESMNLDQAPEGFLPSRPCFLNPSHVFRGFGTWCWQEDADRLLANSLGYFQPEEVTIARGNGHVGMASGPGVMFFPDVRFLDPPSQPSGPGRWEYFTELSEQLARINFGLQEDYPGVPQPTALQMWHLRQRNQRNISRGTRIEDPTEHINLVWIPDIDQHEFEDV
nr:hypothetical protein CFP56_44443 [Quercus suber]